MIRNCALASVCLLLAGCSSASFDRFGGSRAPSLTPAPTQPVESQSLSPLVLDGGQTGQPGDPLGTVPDGQTRQPINNAMGAEAEFAQAPTPSLTTPATARDLKRTDLLGAWTLASGAEQCKLNVNLTNWTGGYRASTRGCASPDLQRINAWRLNGKEVELLAEDGATVMARLFSTSPARFDGQAEQDGRAVSFFR